MRTITGEVQGDSEASLLATTINTEITKSQEDQELPAENTSDTPTETGIMKISTEERKSEETKDIGGKITGRTIKIETEDESMNDLHEGSFKTTSKIDIIRMIATEINDIIKIHILKIITEAKDQRIIIQKKSLEI